MPRVGCRPTLGTVSLNLLLLLVALLPIASGVEAQGTIPLGVSVEVLGKGTTGTVVGVTVAIAAEDRALAGNRLRLRATLTSLDGVVDVLSTEVELDATGRATVYREWLPGRYDLNLTAISLAGSVVGVAAAELQIPRSKEPFEPPAPVTAPSTDVTPPESDSLHFIPPADRDSLDAFDLAVAVPEGTAVVEFYLGSDLVARRQHAPWSVRIPTSAIVRRSHLRAIALDTKGRYLSEDAIVVNSPGDKPGIEILLAPEDAATDGTRQVTVAVTDRRDFRQLSLSLDDHVVARWQRCPCVAEIPLAELADAAVLSVELVDLHGARFVEVTPAGSGFKGAVRVELVELQVQVFDSHHAPVTGLEPEDFSVLEDGRSVAIDGVGTRQELPLSLVLAVDTSSSMNRGFAAVRVAVTGFAASLLTARDRATLIRFANTSEVVVSSSDNPQDIARGLADVTPKSTTSLNDAIIRSLMQIHQLRGRKALVLLTDGEDTSSFASFSDAEWFSRSMRVPIFAITLRTKDAHQMPKFTDQAEVRYRHLLTTLATETGGRAYFRITATQLPEVYEEIAGILRSQYVVWFHPQAETPPDRFRSIEVKVSDPDLKVRTISGYYPAR